MQPARDPSPPSTPSSGRRLLSRFASSLGPKSRNVADFHIQPDEPHRQYSSGDLVKGSVKFRVLRPVRITHIVVCLHGYSQVFKNPGSAPESHTANTGHMGMGRGGRSAQYHGNGMATLFEDEVVLCGDGRLAEGSYQFNFELVFPETALPSSIDFERGTVSYLLTAVLTRPTTIAPTLTFDRKVYFLEHIDISSLYPPKPRTITLDPISKKSKGRTQALKLIDASERKSLKSRSSVTGEQQLPHDLASRVSGSSNDCERPSSPVPSEISMDSHVSSNGAVSQLDSVSISPKTSSVGARNANSKHATKPISATIESCVGGCLRGDLVPVKVSVNHTKYVKSMTGVIVTLFRHARVDLDPPIPIEVGKNSTLEDYYPKSLTGLGGLSLSGAGTSHVYRKDIAQDVQPLVINPATLTADIVAKLRVPEEAFPTISSVPGGMISFKYYLEVIVDVQAKLAAQDSALSNLGGLTNATMTLNGGYESSWHAPNPTGGRILDTTNIRRDKALVSCNFEIIIGTRNTNWRKGKQKLEVAAPTVQQATDVYENAPIDPPRFESLRYTPSINMPSAVDEADNEQRYAQRMLAWRDGNGVNDHLNPTYDASYQAVPLPQIPTESELSEKDRIRLAEARLLPSQPPGADDEAAPEGLEATAPHFSMDGYEMEIGAGPAPQDEYSMPPGELSHARRDHLDLASNAMPIAQVVPSQATTLVPSCNSHSPDGARLATQASVPSAEEIIHGSNDLPASHRTPSAPALAPSYSENLHDSHADASGSSDLPRYES